jgi:hypothetical protein
MTKLKQTWWEKWLAMEENGSSSDSSGEDEVEVTSAKGDSNPGSGNRNPGRKEDRREEEQTQMDAKMVFTILVEFCVPTKDVVELALGAEHAMFEDMKPLFIQGHLDETLVVDMLVDGGARINILPLSLFKKLGHIDGDLKCINLSRGGFAGDPMEAKGIICKELTVGSKIVPMAFFMVDVKGRYNVLLG